MDNAQKNFRLDGKVVVLTGAAGILGAHAVKRFLVGPAVKPVFRQFN